MLLWAGVRRQGSAPPIVRPRRGSTIAFHDYYAMWLPVAIILQSALRHPGDLLLLALQVVLFPVRARQAAARLGDFVRPAARQPCPDLWLRP
jgi:hypothetical protein